MRAYYNEFDPYCAQWLRNLIDAGHIPPGDVDERSITEVKADEIKAYDQWHFFAGLGGWGYAARLAGIGEAKGILTGSPPCQPFSNAGKRQGYADERHLAPVWLDLVAALRPDWVFGEQVAAAIKKDDWLDDLLDALEREGYTTGAAVFPACGVGAPHIRQRLWVVARLGDSQQPGLEGHAWDGDRSEEPGWVAEDARGSVAEAGESSGVADTSLASISGRRIQRPGESDCTVHEPESKQRFERSNPFGRLADSTNGKRRTGQHDTTTERQQGDSESCGSNRNGRMANPGMQRRQQDARGTHGDEAANGPERRNFGKPHSHNEPTGHGEIHASSQTQAGWDDPDWLWCRDGKWRPVESGTFPLANGVSARVGRLRAYGNAIVPQVAAEVIKTAMEAQQC